MLKKTKTIESGRNRRKSVTFNVGASDNDNGSDNDDKQKIENNVFNFGEKQKIENNVLNFGEKQKRNTLR